MGTRFEFTVTLISDDLEAALHEWFDYGALRGLGQWRNSGKGRFHAALQWRAEVLVA